MKCFEILSKVYRQIEYPVADHMYQEKSAPALLEDEALLLQAIVMVEESGLRGLSLRTLAQKAGISPSLLTYRYGSREGLIRKVFDHARTLDEAAWQTWEKSFGDEGTPGVELASIAMAVVMDAVTCRRRTSLMHWLCMTAFARDQSLVPFAPDWAGLAAQFWRGRFREIGLAEELAAPFAAGLSGAIRIGLLARQDARLYAWMSDVVLRLCERMLGRPASLSGDSAARRAVERTWLEQPGHQLSSRTETPERILESAVALIVRRGPDALTHRLIAEDSGISLSSMTHHFSSLDEIMVRAFGLIYGRARRESMTGLPEGVSAKALSREVLPLILRRARARGPESAAMDEIILSASRKPETAPLAGALMAMAGQTSTTLLQGLQPAHTQPDRLDGHIFRFVLSGLGEQSEKVPSDQRDDWVATNCERFLELYVSEL